MADKAMVAMCDILGFENLVKHKPLEEIKNEFISNFINLLKSCIPERKSFTQPTKEEIFGDGVVGYAVFSDTVLLYSLSDDKYGYENLIYRATGLLAELILFPEFRFRIGISYGDFYNDPEKNIYVGKALIEAHELEKKQKWCGGAFTKSAEERIKETDVDSFYLEHYEVPVESNKTESHLVINWTLAKHKEIEKEYGWLKRNYDLLTPEFREAEYKLKNTEKFHLDVCEQCKVYRNIKAKT